MKIKKIYSQKLTHGNYIVRDHLVYGVRTLPGVALLDMIYRLSINYLGTNSIELKQILFMQPIVTSEDFDRNIFVEFTPFGSHWEVSVTSKKIKNETVLDTLFVENMKCLLYLRADENKKCKLDVITFIENAGQQWDMDEMYEMARNVDIKHLTFMKTLGRVYQSGNEEVMRLQLSELAETHFDIFHAHVAFLDGASMAGISFAKNKTQNWINQDHSPYMPISIERFCIHQTLPKIIYTHTGEREALGDIPINPDLVSRNIRVFNEFGDVLVEFDKFSVKRIREPQLIKKLIENQINHSNEYEEVKPYTNLIDQVETYAVNNSNHQSSGDTKRIIMSYLQKEIAIVLNVNANEISTNEGFYELGLDSIQLLGFVKLLEQKVKESMYPTLLFEYSTIENLSQYLLENYMNIFLDLNMSVAEAISHPTNSDTKQIIVSYLQKEIARVLKVNADEIITNEGFYELGLDSIQLLGLVKVLEEKVDESLYPTLLFEYPTIENLSQNLLENYENVFLSLNKRASGLVAEVTCDMTNTDMKQIIVSFLQKEISKVLKIKAEEIGINEGFYELGLDSIQLLGIVKVLEQKVDESIYPTLLFEYSTVENLSQYLLDTYSYTFVNWNKKETELMFDMTNNQMGENISKLYFERIWRRKEIRKSDFLETKRHNVVVLYESLIALQSYIQAQPFIDAVITLHSNQENIEDQLEDKFKQLLHLIQTYLEKRDKKDLLLQVVSNSSEESKYVYALEGLLKTAFLENPKIHSQIISIEHINSQSDEAIIELLNNEARSHDNGVFSIHYKVNPVERYVKQLKELDIKETIPNYKENGVYVITGGMGGLGFLVANHLASQQKVKLALIGRSKLDTQKNQKIRQLIQKGAEVLYLESDISNQTETEKAFNCIKDQWGSISGVFHCAGLLKDQIIINKNLNEISEVFDPKVRGIWNIDKVTQDEKLDYFILFSSVSAITGNIGQADYASANAWMDIFALERQENVMKGKRTGRTITINWPLWSEGGMQIDEEIQHMFYSLGGNLALPTLEGLRAMDAILAQDKTQTIVFYGNADHIRNHIKDNVISEESTLPIHQSVDKNDDIAIIGLAGRYPMANNMEEFYSNLKEGKDCITNIPKDRWENNSMSYNVEELYNFGGFIDRIDEFDPLFFNISANQAEMMDPQARLFLQTAWEACEDAGFQINRSKHFYPSSSDKSVGVFAGAFWNNYELFSAEMTQRGTPTAFGVSSASIANMVSYCLNFHGPSMAIDSMCSSSLTAIHLACESIRRGECHYALAGGVNLATHPHKYLFLKQAQFLSSDGKCRSFGKDGDGYVPGEGVGAILLTSVSQAEKEGYPIYGVIKGSAINHVGKTSGATVPDPVAQSEVIADAIIKSGINPRTVSYVEAHGTGTSLGDPIELHGLERAFKKWSNDKEYCAVGSLKSNIGHLEAASGIAGLTKILLQFKYKELFPSLHSETLNPYISFEDTSFHVQRSNEEWKRPEIEVNGKGVLFPRRAGISSFGANGSNAHVVIEEYINNNPRKETVDRKGNGFVIVPLSAKNKDCLKIYVEKFVEFFSQDKLFGNELEDSHSKIKDLAYTLQVGREPMMYRVAFVVRSINELSQKMEWFIKGKGEQEIENCFQCGDDENKRLFQGLTSDEDFDETIEKLIVTGEICKIAELWSGGLAINWKKLYGETKPSRINVPTYPFAKERYWVPQEKTETNSSIIAPATAMCSNHPLLLLHTSILSEKKHSSIFKQEKEELSENCWNFAIWSGKI